MAVVDLDEDGEHRGDNHRDSVIVEPAAREDKVDSNVVDRNDVEDGERDYGVVDCNDSLVRNVDKEQLEVLVEPRGPHVPRSWHQDTSPLGDEYVSNVDR